MTNKGIEWKGGACPVHPKSIVKYWLRNGTIRTGVAGDNNWGRDKAWPEYDIIAFCIVSPYKEPKTVWVNEYASGNISYDNQEDAKLYGDCSCIRKAVKYQEVIE